MARRGTGWGVVGARHGGGRREFIVPLHRWADQHGHEVAAQLTAGGPQLTLVHAPGEARQDRHRRRRRRRRLGPTSDVLDVTPKSAGRHRNDVVLRQRLLGVHGTTLGRRCGGADAAALGATSGDEGRLLHGAHHDAVARQAADGTTHHGHRASLHADHHPVPLRQAQIEQRPGGALSRVHATGGGGGGGVRCCSPHLEGVLVLAAAAAGGADGGVGALRTGGRGDLGRAAVHEAQVVGAPSGGRALLRCRPPQRCVVAKTIPVLRSQQPVPLQEVGGVGGGQVGHGGGEHVAQAARGAVAALHGGVVQRAGTVREATRARPAVTQHRRQRKRLTATVGSDLGSRRRITWGVANRGHAVLHELVQALGHHVPLRQQRDELAPLGRHAEHVHVVLAHVRQQPRHDVRTVRSDGGAWRRQGVAPTKGATAEQHGAREVGDGTVAVSHQ